MWFIYFWFSKSTYDQRVQKVMTILQNANIRKPNTIKNIPDSILEVPGGSRYTWKEYEGRPPKIPEFIYKNCFYSYMFKLQSFSKYSPFDAIHLSRLFSTAQNSFWTHRFWYLSVLLLVFCFTSSTSVKCFPLRTFFIWGNKQQKKLLAARWGE